MNMRGRLGKHDGSLALVGVSRTMATSNANGAQKGLAAALLLGYVLRSRGEDLELLPEKADGRGQPLGIVGEGKGDGTGGWWRKSSIISRGRSLHAFRIIGGWRRR